jgi:hypothetical protein
VHTLRPQPLRQLRYTELPTAGPDCTPAMLVAPVQLGQGVVRWGAVHAPRMCKSPVLYITGGRGALKQEANQPKA